MNKTILIGRLTKDPETRTTQNGKNVTNFSIAVQRPYTKDKTDFFNCVAFGKTGEIVAQYFKKGSRIGLSGHVQIDKVEKDGNARYFTSIVANDVEFIDTKAESTQTEAVEELPEIDDKDLPF